MDINYETNPNSEPFPPFPPFAMFQERPASSADRTLQMGGGGPVYLDFSSSFDMNLSQTFLSMIVSKKKFLHRVYLSPFPLQNSKNKQCRATKLVWGYAPLKITPFDYFPQFKTTLFCLTQNHYFTLLENQIKCQPCAHCFARLVLQSPFPNFY